jgi:hypothetical protein
MPRAYPHSHVCNGQLVGFSVAKFGDNPTYFACFKSTTGQRLKRDTNQTRQGQAVEAAKAIIEELYAPKLIPPDKVTWDRAVDRLTARLATSGNREGTVGYYLKCLRLVKSGLPDTIGPEDVTPILAAAWRDRVMTTQNRRKKLPSAHYVAGLLGGLSAIWQKWFIDDLKIVADNPWAEVDPPRRQAGGPLRDG